MTDRDAARLNLISAVKLAGLYFGAAKSYDQFRARLWGACQRLFSGGKDRYFESGFVRSIDVQLTEAWNEGAADVGVMPEDMTETDHSILENVIDSETEFINGIAGDIATARDSGMKREDFDRQFGARVDLWANRYNETVNRARTYFGGRQRLKWNIGATEEHCPFCSALDGIVAYAEEWFNLNLQPQSPPNPALTGEKNGEKGCEGWRCDCHLDPTDEKRTYGALKKIRAIINHD